jgi:hypothetical protein
MWRRVEGRSIQQGGMEEAPENDKESSHSAHDNGMDEFRNMLGRRDTKPHNP